MGPELLTGVKNDSATNLALAFNYIVVSVHSQTDDPLGRNLKQAYSLTNSFISDISLSTSSMNCIMKSTSLCFNISSVCTFVIRKEMSYPYVVPIINTESLLPKIGTVQNIP